MKKYAIYGAGAFGQEVYLYIKDILSSESSQYEFIGFIDDGLSVGTEVKYGSVIGNIDLLNSVDYELDVAFAINHPAVIRDLYLRITNRSIKFPNYIHPSVSWLDKDSVTLGKGNIITGMGLISFDVKMGDFNMLNTRVSLGHHVEVGSFNIFNPNVQVSGNVKIADSNIFGLNVGIIPGRKIGSSNTIGAGGILTRNIGDGLLYIGNPAQKVKFD